MKGSLTGSGARCPWCSERIEAGQDTARVGNYLWHAGCAEDMEMARLEEAEV